ncbi:MAG: undecaprenyl-diphosphate phosphatase [Gammaproteobacteria bacterium]|nr:undecaprenyl-diphosphate phosphatase [Gammaproteobacteria bacterium]
MDFVHTLILAIVQGITEFLPISSSAHLILTSVFLGWEDQGVTFDLALNVGTLLAVVIYFRKDVRCITLDTLQSIAQRKQVGTSSLGWMIAFATIPAGLFGLFLMDIVDSHLRNPQVILFTTLFYALLLWLSDKYGKKIKTIEEMTFKNAIVIGVAQALALIPGTSRSGVTITMALFLGYDFKTASRFSFLMAIPVITLATAVKITDDALSLENIPWVSFLIGCLISFITAMLAIHYFLKWLNHWGMTPYVIYRLLLALALAIFIVAR